MARKPREDFPGAWHHMFNRGARREPIFLSDDHCGLFLSLLDEAAEQWGMEVHAYALMPNHFHLLIRSLRGRLSQFGQQLFGQYTQQLNRIKGWDGSLFRGRFKTQLARDENYLTYLLGYIHLNPVRANLVLAPEAFGWTSHQAYLDAAVAPKWLARDYFLDVLGGADGVREFVRALHAGVEPWPEVLDLESGRLGRLATAKNDDQRRHETPLSRAATTDDVVERVCTLTNSGPEALLTARRGRQGNPARRFAAWALRQSTDMTESEIGKRLDMSANQVSAVLWRLRRTQVKPPLDVWMSTWRDENSSD